MIKHKFYWTCEYCGANLDYGEKCDCPESQIDVDYSDVKPSISNKDIQKGGMTNDKATSIDGR